MNRRKGVTTGSMNERDFPHLIELPVPPRGFQGQDVDFDAFHREHGIPIRCGSGHQKKGGNSTCVSAFRVAISPMPSATSSVANTCPIQRRGLESSGSQ
jgi:hypothetical protein